MSVDLVPPYHVQPLIPGITVGNITCAQALGSEVYVGCNNGELLRYTLQAEKQESYSLVSRQSLPSGKSIDELVLIPYMSRMLILSDRQIHIYTLPSLDPVPNIKPLRHVEVLAVDQLHLSRTVPATHDVPSKLPPVDFCVIKRNAIALYSLYEERLAYSKEMPFQAKAQLARRAGQFLCVADDQYYNVIDLYSAQMVPVIPVNQIMDDPTPIKPFILVIGENEFLVFSWTGGSTLGVFITGEGDPVRGTLAWPSYPLSVCLDYPNVTTLLPNGTIEIHSVETQSIIQVLPAPPDSDGIDQRIGLATCLGRYVVPFSEYSERMRRTTLRFDRK